MQFTSVHFRSAVQDSGDLNVTEASRFPSVVRFGFDMHKCQLYLTVPIWFAAEMHYPLR